jgi:hypothetical protein
MGEARVGDDYFGVFRYFRAELKRIRGLGKSKQRCDLCAAEDWCIDIRRDEDLKGKRGCLGCLHARRFSVYHGTERDYVLNQLMRDVDLSDLKPDEKGRTVIPDDRAPQMPAGFRIPKEAESEFCHTPDFLSWQEPQWLVHCDDFMAYLGPIYPDEYKEYTSTESVTEFFNRCTDNQYPHYAPQKESDEYGMAHFHLFECLHCKTHRADLVHG